MGSTIVTFRGCTQCSQLCSLELPMLQQRLATFVVVTEDMGMEGMVDTMDMVDMDIMERDLLKLKLILSQDTSEDMAAMATAVDMVVMEVTDMEVDTMARGRLKLWLKLMLSQDISEDMAAMVIAVDMVVMEVSDMDVDTMARERLKL